MTLRIKQPQKPLNMVELMDTLEIRGATKSDDSVAEVEKPKDPPSLRGYAKKKPISAESSEYDNMPNAPPHLWVQKYCLSDFLTPVSKKLYKKAKAAYAGVKVEESDSDGDTIETKKAKWFSLVSEVMAARRLNAPGPSSVAIQRRGPGRPRKAIGKGDVTVVEATPQRRGRGRPRKQNANTFNTASTKPLSIKQARPIIEAVRVGPNPRKRGRPGKISQLRSLRPISVGSAVKRSKQSSDKLSTRRSSV